MLRTRVVTAMVLLAIVGAALFLLPQWCGIGLLGIVLVIGAWEWSAFAGCTGAISRLGYVAATAVMATATYRGLTIGTVAQLLWLAVVWWCVAGVRLAFAGVRVSAGMTLVAGWLALIPALAAVMRLFAGASSLPGSAHFLMLAGLVSAADIGAYFAGRRFGRHKLAPQISPGKTWEGVLGGAVSVMLVAYGIAATFGFSRAGFVVLSAVVFVASVVGDLTESLYKRGAGLKDSGFILPGHGGVLDRIDSLLAAAPFYVLGLEWLGMLQ
jgi:phosphatidate cytidylyltransferase